MSVSIVSLPIEVRLSTCFSGVIGGVSGLIALFKVDGMTEGDVLVKRERGRWDLGREGTSATGSAFGAGAGLVGGLVRGSQRLRGVGVSISTKKAGFS